MTRREILRRTLIRVILESRATRDWIARNVDPEDPSESADLYIAYSDGITNTNALSWIKSVRKQVPQNYQSLGIPLSPGEVSLTALEFDDTIDINYLVNIVREFMDPTNQSIMSGNGISTNLSLKDYPGIAEVLRVLNSIRAYKQRKKERKNRREVPQNIDTSDIQFDPENVEVLGKVGPWILLLPLTTEGSIACDINVVRDTTWCTAKREGENLFMQYVGDFYDKLILFYVMDYSRRPKDVNKEYKVPCIDDNDSRMSIAFSDGVIEFSNSQDEGIGGRTVDAANTNITESALKRVLGSNYDRIISILERKASDLGGVHPAQEKTRELAGDILLLKDHVKNFKPASKYEAYSSLYELWESHEKERQNFSKEVIEFLLWNHKNFHIVLMNKKLPTMNKKSIKEYIKEIEGATQRSFWLFGNPSDQNEVNQNNINVNLDYLKLNALYTIINNATKSLDIDLLTSLQEKCKNYLYAAYGERGVVNKSQLLPGLFKKEDEVRYAALSLIDKVYINNNVPDNIIPLEMKEYREAKENISNVNVFKSSTMFMKELSQTTFDNGGEYSSYDSWSYLPPAVRQSISNMTNPWASKENKKMINQKEFNSLSLKDNLLSYFAIQSQYDERNYLPKDRRDISEELVLAYHMFSSAIQVLKPRPNSPENAKEYFLSNPFFPVYGEIIYKLLEIFPEIKSFPLVGKTKASNFLFEKGQSGLGSALTLVSNMLASGVLTSESLDRLLIHDAPGGFLYEQLLYIDRSKVSDDVIGNFINNVQVARNLKRLIGSLCEELIKRYPDKKDIIEKIRIDKESKTIEAHKYLR